MIRKNTNAYRLIKNNIGVLTLIHQATGISPSRLVIIYLKNLPPQELFIKKKTKDEYWSTDLISEKSAYKYFRHASQSFLDEFEENPNYTTLREVFKNTYLKKCYFGQDFHELLNVYLWHEKAVKNFVKEAFVQAYPLTPNMSPREKAIRNQKLGKISVNHWIGDIVHYDYFSQAPNFMMVGMNNAIKMIELYVANILNESQLTHELMKLKINQRLEARLKPKSAQKIKVTKI